MQTSITAKWQSNMAFETDVNGYVVRTDAPVEVGGDSSGAGPKKLMLVALAGCTGVDVVEILRKKRVEIEELSITVKAQLTEDIPSVYSAMHIIYEFKGKNLEKKKLEQAVQLSQDKYCGVSMMYKQIMELSWEIRQE